jgi:hypothetical protein
VATLQVPQRHRSAVGQLTNLSAKQIGELNDAILSTDGSQRAVRQVVQKAVEQGSLAYEALITIAAVRVSYQMSAKEAADQVSRSLGDEAGSGDLALLFDNPTIVRLAKQADLLVAYEKGLHSFRIFTDVRPIFAENVELPIKAVLITSTLQLAYHQDGRIRESYMRVDTDDLRRMLEQTERALAKITTAERFATDAGAEVLTDDPEEL